MQDSGVAQCSFEGSSGSAAAVLGAELLDGASFGSNHASKAPQMPEEMEVVSGEAIMSARTVRKRRIAGIFQHYYPEGGWGFVVVIVAVIVQIITHGLQLSFGILILAIKRRWPDAGSVQMSEYNLFLFIFLVKLQPS